MSRHGTALQTENEIHPTAQVHPDARLAGRVVVGAYAVIGPGVEIGAGTHIGPHAVIEGPTRMGADNKVYSFAALGTDPQHRRYDGEPTRLELGDRNVIREFVTMNRGTVDGGGATRVGSDNLFMAYVHVAHDCQVGDHVTLANAVTLAGHVRVDDHVVFGGLAAVGQFLRVGESAMVAAGAMVEIHVPPFCIVQGDRARVRGLNLVGLKRRGVSGEELRSLKRIYQQLFLDASPRRLAVRELAAGSVRGALAERLVRFLEETAVSDLDAT